MDFLGSDHKPTTVASDLRCLRLCPEVMPLGVTDKRFQRNKRYLTRYQCHVSVILKGNRSAGIGW